jgi:uncharacterized membrane protein YkvA (DUF1232 family)
MSKFIRRIRFMLNVRKFVPFLIAYFKSTEVSVSKKLTSVLLVVSYFIFPFDLIPDFLMIFGIIDDVAVLTFVMSRIVKTAPQYLKDQFEL